MTLPLHDITVLDCCDGVAGQFTGKMFAAFGADVILVEPPGGAATRLLDPLATRPSGERWSYLFEHLNGAKSSVELSADAPGDQLAELLIGADVVLHDGLQPPWWPPLDERIVDCVLNDFPEVGAYAHWSSTEMVQQALCGSMYQTGAHERFPLYGVGHRSAYAAGTTAFIAGMAALVERASSKLGQVVRTSTFEAVAAMGENLISLYSYSGMQPERRPSSGLLGTFRCRDEWVVLFALTTWQAVCDTFAAPDLLDDERFVKARDRMLHWPEARKLLQERAAELPAAEVVARAQAAKIPCEIIESLDGLVTSPQWQARDMVVVHPDDGSGNERSPVRHALGPMFRVDGGGYVAEPAPVLGARRPRQERRPADAPPAANVGPARTPPAGSGARGRGPLSGVTVIDLTTAWSGPMATRCLSFLGADVIKVEPPTRLDPWRGMYLGKRGPFFPDSVGGERRYDRCVSFNTQGHDKRSFGLDVTAPGGAEVLNDLLRDADVLIANYTSGVLDRLGFGYDAVSSLNPGIVVVEMPAFGVGGPLARHVAMGNTMEAACGMAGLIGYGDGRPVLTGSTVLDPIGGLNGAAAVLVGLHRRNVGGRGCHVEVAQTEVAAHWIGEYLLAQLDEGATFAPHGNVVGDAEPHDAFACSGHDEWVAVAVENDDQWRGLCAALGKRGLADDERFATFAARREHRDALHEVVGGWTARRTKLDAAAQLQKHGVPAAPVNRGVDVFFDPVLRQAGFIVELDHPEAGRKQYPSLAFHLSRTPGCIDRPAPCFGQDNREILTRVLGYSTERIEELYADRAVSDGPIAPRSRERAKPT